MADGTVQVITVPVVVVVTVAFKNGAVVKTAVLEMLLDAAVVRITVTVVPVEKEVVVEFDGDTV